MLTDRSEPTNWDVYWYCRVKQEIDPGPWLSERMTRKRTNVGAPAPKPRLVLWNNLTAVEYADGGWCDPRSYHPKLWVEGAPEPKGVST